MLLPLASIHLAIVFTPPTINDILHDASAFYPKISMQEPHVRPAPQALQPDLQRQKQLANAISVCRVTAGIAQPNLAPAAGGGFMVWVANRPVSGALMDPQPGQLPRPAKLPIAGYALQDMVRMGVVKLSLHNSWTSRPWIIPHFTQRQLPSWRPINLLMNNHSCMRH